MSGTRFLVGEGSQGRRIATDDPAHGVAADAEPQALAPGDAGQAGTPDSDKARPAGRELSASGLFRSRRTDSSASVSLNAAEASDRALIAALRQPYNHRVKKSLHQFFQLAEYISEQTLRDRVNDITTRGHANPTLMAHLVAELRDLPAATQDALKPSLFKVIEAIVPIAARHFFATEIKSDAWKPLATLLADTSALDGKVVDGIYNAFGQINQPINELIKHSILDLKSTNPDIQAAAINAVLNSFSTVNPQTLGQTEDDSNVS